MGKVVEVGGNGGGGEVLLYVAKLAPWTRVMVLTMAKLETLLLSHPPEQYIDGIKYNHGQGAIHEVIINGWYGGLHVSCATHYPTGDDGSATMQSMSTLRECALL